MKVNSNIQGMIAQAILSTNETKMQASTQKMSSGYKINYAKDNPAGMAITNRMKAQLKSLDRATKNAGNAVNAIQTAEGAMGEIENMLQRMNELAIQAANGTNSSTDRQAIQEEVDQLSSEIARISKDTSYNSQGLLDGYQSLKGYSKDPQTVNVRGYNELFDYGKYNVTVDNKGIVTLTKGGSAVTGTSQDVVTFTDPDGVVTGFSTTVRTLDGGEITIETKDPAGVSTAVELDISGLGGMKIQVGAEQGQEIQVVIPEISLRTLNFVDLNGERVLNCTTEKKATEAIEKISEAIKYVSAARSKVGAYQNRIESTISNLNVSSENLTGSYSTMKDLDMAEGMVEYTTLQVLIQAGTTMLAQANEQPQQALQLLQ